MPQQPGDNDDALTTVTVSSDTPADYVPPPAIHHQAKQGGKFCCCCCDYRRAVIILGCVTLTMGMMDLVFFIGNIDATTPAYDDDELNNELISLNDTYRMLYMSLEAMAVVFGAVSIMGAWTFSIFGTSVALVYGIASSVVSLLLDLQANESTNEILTKYNQETAPQPIFYYCVVGVTAVIWWYPSAFFLWEVHQGIMSSQTYVREEYSCCCTV